MSDHTDRMKIEHNDLTIKIKALNAFIHRNDIFKTLSDLEQVKMVKQVGFMESYASVLESRIWSAVKTA